MKVKVSDYIVWFLVEHGISHCFTVVGGGAMHMNDSFGHQEGLTCIYNHHEQACAMAAEAYARIGNHVAAVCVTSGPGGTNAITGVLCAWEDSLPLLVFSGQVRRMNMARSTGLAGLRMMGDQEYDIVPAVTHLTKYAVLLDEPKRVRYCLEKALHLARSGRPGPCWLDVPLDVQAAVVDDDALVGYEVSEDAASRPPAPSDEVVDAILDKISMARRPVFHPGNGIRLAGAYGLFRRVADKLGIPIVTCWDSVDLVPDAHPLYVGREGIAGTRAGNFAIQTADLIFAVGARLGMRDVGFDAERWAPHAFVIMSDICPDEMRKPTIHVEMPVWADARELLERLELRLDERIAAGAWGAGRRAWAARCRAWRERYPVLLARHHAVDEPANLYMLIDALSRALEPGRVVVTGSGATCVAGSQGFVIKEGTRYLINCGVCPLGYDLPAAIGACVAEHGDSALYGRGTGLRDTILFTGDGSIQFNLQELQVIVHHRLPIKIFVVNNQGYHSIRQTQQNNFSGDPVGIGPDSGDLSFPDMGRIAAAYGLPYARCERNSDLDATIGRVLALEGPALCEVMTTIDQPFEPKLASRVLEDGTTQSPGLEDLAPFLPRDELARIMSVVEE